MADLSKLSVEEIRERYVRGNGPVSPRLLARLKRDRRQGVRRIYEVLRRRHEKERDARLRLDAMLNFERILWKSGASHVAGVDEAGMGPLAGPVVAAAVVFPAGTWIPGIDDSKRLDAESRAALHEEIRRRATGVGVGLAEVEEIDRLNIYQAGLLAMRRAVQALPDRPDHVLVDARAIPDLAVPQSPFNRGDGINFSIAAASIVAKIHRDRLMERLDRRYPGYGFARHKGYATPQHQAAIRRRGPCPIHRRSFAFLGELRGDYSALIYQLKRRLEGAGAVEELRSLETELGACREALGESEQRKLRLVLSRRWKAL